MSTNAIGFFERQFNLDTQRKISYAADRGYIIRPITIYCLPRYQVIVRNIPICVCDLLSDAADVATALAYYHNTPPVIGEGTC